MTWTLLNRSHAVNKFTHYVFLDVVRGKIAVADHSIRNLDDPSSTDDGLLVVTGKPYDRSEGFFVPVSDADGITSNVLTTYRVASLVSALWDSKD